MSTAASLENLTSMDSEMESEPIGLGLELPVFVIFTSINQTLQALEKACQLAQPRRSGIEIMAVQPVPFALPLDDPSVPFNFLIRRLKDHASQFPVQIKISGYLCRNLFETLTRVLNRDCPVVMGVKKRWWPTRDERVARKLQRAGYDVSLVKTE
jgi:hypothetical protein